MGCTPLLLRSLETRDRAEPPRATEVADVPLPGLRLLAEVLVGVHRDGVADRLEHRQVADRVRVRVRALEVETYALGEVADRLGLRLARAVELELARVASVLDPGSGGDHARDAEVPRERPHDLLGRGAPDVDPAAVLPGPCPPGTSAGTARARTTWR